MMQALTETLKNKTDLLAQKITDLHYKKNPKFEKYGEYGRIKCKEDAVYHLKYLSEALEAKSPALFEEYIRWAAVMLRSRKISVNDLLVNLDFIYTTVNEEIPELGYDTGKYISKAKRILLKEITIATYINTKNPLSELAAQYNKLLLNGKRNLATTLIMDSVDSGISVKEIYEYVFIPSQYEIGRLWQLNEISVAQEHYATAATQLIMSMLYPKIFTGNNNGKTLIATCVSGDLHEIGIRIVSDYFEMEGWNTFFLGSNTPHRSIIDMAKKEKADVIAISATISFNISEVRKIIELIRKDPELDEVKIMVGGYPFSIDKNLYKSIGADATANTANEAIQTINELII